MKKIVYLYLFICLLSGSPLHACTGFAVYGDKIFYGMNFDYPDRELKFLVQQNAGHKIFHLQFHNNSQFVSTCGMNDRGILCTEQEQYPMVFNTRPLRSNEKYMWDLYQSTLENYANLDQLLAVSNTFRLVHASNLCLHVLLCDKTGTAFIAEVGQDDNAITIMDGNYIVMTNFRNASFQNVPLTEISGEGADRYVTACNFISQKVLNFTYEDGFEVLRRTMQNTNACRTQCSMLFSPNEALVYIALRGDFNRIWKLSIDNKTIETYTGFTGNHIIDLDANGITASALKQASAAYYGPEKPDKFTLYQNYPNPFNPATMFRYYLHQPGQVTLKIYNTSGQHIETLVNEVQPAGDQSIFWQPSGLASGVYFARLQSGPADATIKLLLQN